MTADTASQESVLRELRRIKARLGADYGVTRIGIFGSVARGTATADSDLDVVVEMTPNLFLRAALRAELERHFGMPVDVVRYREGMNGRLKTRIDREARYA